MDLDHALVEVHTVVFLLCNADVGTRGERVVLLLDFLDGGDLAEAEYVLVLAIAEFLDEPLMLAGGFEGVLECG